MARKQSFYVHIQGEIEKEPSPCRVQTEEIKGAMPGRCSTSRPASSWPGPDSKVIGENTPKQEIRPRFLFHFPPSLGEEEEVKRKAMTPARQS